MKTGRVWQTAVAAALVLLLAAAGETGSARAECILEVKNQTGYDLSPLKLVREKGRSKKVVHSTFLANGKSCTFTLAKSGPYRVYGRLHRKGREIFAKGNLHNLEDDYSYNLILKEVDFSEEGSAITFISREEFESLR